MSRWLALTIAIFGGAAAAFTAILALVAVVYGVLWVFVFGDEYWPAWVDQSLNIAVPVAGLLLWALIAWRSWVKLRPNS